jgi:hypothetical protein
VESGQVDRRAGGQAGRRTGGQVDRQTSRLVNRWIGGQVGSLEYCRWTVGQVDKWRDTKAHKLC